MFVFENNIYVLIYQLFLSVLDGFGGNKYNKHRYIGRPHPEKRVGRGGKEVFFMPLTIAIDGPVGAGKSTVSDAAAEALGILHLDTGAMYRAAGLAASRQGISPDDEEGVARAVRAADIAVRYENGRQVTMLNGEDVSTAIRTQEAGQMASAVSRFAPVRRQMVKLQQQLARTTAMLVDGRDIGTVVLPDAPVKIFLTASPEARALRRQRELIEKGQKADFETILAEVNARDDQDTHREVDPLRQAEDAVVLDSSEMTFEETVAAILRIVFEKTGIRPVGEAKA